MNCYVFDLGVPLKSRTTRCCGFQYATRPTSPLSMDTYKIELSVGKRDWILHLDRRVYMF